MVYHFLAIASDVYPRFIFPKILRVMLINDLIFQCGGVHKDVTNPADRKGSSPGTPGLSPGTIPVSYHAVMHDDSRCLCALAEGGHRNLPIYQNEIEIKFIQKIPSNVDTV